MYIAVAGNIGAGKSSLTRLLAERYGLRPVFEAVDENPYLEDFYADMRRWAFHSQMFFLAKRLRQHLEQVNPGERIIQDRTIYEDAAVFARNLHEEGVLAERDWDSYRQMYTAISAALRPPDLLVYLKAGLPKLKRHIRLRGRAYEAGISDGYLERLNALYDRWIESYRAEHGESAVLTIETDALDFVHDQVDLERILERLEGHGLVPQLVR